MKSIFLAIFILIGTLMLCSGNNSKSLETKIKGNFHTLARWFSLGDSTLAGSLKKNDLHWNNEANIDLNNFIGNHYGNLVWGLKNYSQTCIDCTIKNQTFLVCHCFDTQSGFKKLAFIDLSHKISNNNGQFRFDG